MAFYCHSERYNHSNRNGHNTSKCTNLSTLLVLWELVQSMCAYKHICTSTAMHISTHTHTQHMIIYHLIIHLFLAEQKERQDVLFYGLLLVRLLLRKVVHETQRHMKNSLPPRICQTISYCWIPPINTCI